MADPNHLSGQVGALWRRLGLRSAVASPIVVAGHIWGLIIAGSVEAAPLPVDAEERVARFSDLVATAIANAEAGAALAASRARLVTAGDEMRRRIERNLHDGAQQRLVTLALRLRSVEDRVPAESADLREHLASIETGMRELLDELRELSRGLHPAVLSQAGLGPALRAVARRAQVPVVLAVADGPRLPETIEAAGYYVVSEALANAAKYAQASEVHVSARVDDGHLRLQIRDDGVGGADPRLGTGLIGLQDRVEALGGTLLVSSPRGAGTTIDAKLPIVPGEGATSR
jgi:signal transduction histidine kinase